VLIWTAVLLVAVLALRYFGGGDDALQFDYGGF
jgi:hypothetical protein